MYAQAVYLQTVTEILSHIRHESLCRLFSPAALSKPSNADSKFHIYQFAVVFRSPVEEAVPDGQHLLSTGHTLQWIYGVVVGVS